MPKLLHLFIFDVFIRLDLCLAHVPSFENDSGRNVVSLLPGCVNYLDMLVVSVQASLQAKGLFHEGNEHRLSFIDIFKTCAADEDKQKNNTETDNVFNQLLDRIQPSL